MVVNNSSLKIDYKTQIIIVISRSIIFVFINNEYFDSNYFNVNYEVSCERLNVVIRTLLYSYILYIIKFYIQLYSYLLFY